MTVLFIPVAMVLNEYFCVVGTTALHDSCRYGYEAVAQLLIEHNADVHVKDKQGLTPLQVIFMIISLY